MRILLMQVVNQAIIIDLQMYSEFYEQMSKNYPSIHFWPQPYAYMQWFETLPPEYKNYYMAPEIYSENYQFSIRKYKESLKPTKVSRNQKRAIKKKQMQEELEKEKAAIGNWVKLERKDLIQGLERIEAKERKLKEKKREKYSHLIEIHKEVYKHHLKMGGSKEPPNRRVNLKNKKKRLSYIKKMKLVFEKKVNKRDIDNHPDNEWESEEEEEEPDSKAEVQMEKSSDPTINIKIEDLQKIKYMEMGKLTSKYYQNIILRQWVRNVPNEKLEDITLRLVNRLAYKQAIRKVQKPTKAKKLIVSGIKECKRTIETIIDKNRSKALIVALNIERNPLRKGVDDEVQNTIKSALHINIPVIHVTTRSKLGRAFTGKFGPRITMISIVNFQGYQDMMEELITNWKQACQKYAIL